MKSQLISRFGSRCVASSLLVTQAFLGTIALQELSLKQTSLQTGYTAQAKDMGLDAAEVYAKAKGAIVRIESGESIGSGVIIGQDGLIVTNAHVLSNPAQVMVKLANGRQVKAKVISLGKSGCVDLALLQISGMQNLPTLKLAPLNAVMPGQDIVAIGFPLGMQTASVTQGIVSSIYAEEGWIQHSGLTNPGNSGGALINSRGELIGIHTRVRKGAIGIGFAISTDQIQAIAQAAQNHLSPRLAAYVRLTSANALPLVADRAAIQGRLQSNDQQMCEDKSAVDLYTFQGKANQPVILEMSGESINPYMVLLGPDGQAVAVTPSEGNDTTRRLSSTLPMDGTYTVMANSQKANQFGRYALRAITPILLQVGELGKDAPLSQNGVPYRSYSFSGKAKQMVEVKVSSQGFDPVVVLLNGQGKVMWQGKLLSDGNLNLELPEDGNYQVVISTVNPQAIGKFAVTIEPKTIVLNPFAAPAVAQH